MTKVTLYLMGEKGLRVLEGLVQNNFTPLIEAVVVGRDKKVLDDYADAIIDLGQQNKVDVYERWQAILPVTGYAMAIAWRWIIDCDKESTRLITFHDSILPEYRGFAPLVNQLINGEKELGVTAFFAAEEFDRGAVIAISKISITYPIKIREAITKISGCYCELALSIFNKIADSQKLSANPQDESRATYSLWRDETDYRIDWNRSAAYIQRFIHAVGFPYLGASSMIGSRKIRVMEAALADDVKIINRDVGKVLFMKDGRPTVVCGSGLIQITEAHFDDDGTSVLPLSRFRIRFK